MLFNSPIYIYVFLPIVVAVYFILTQRHYVKTAQTCLVLASLFFYGYWNPVYLLLIGSSMLVNFWLGNAIHRAQSDTARQTLVSAKHLMIIGIVFNFSLLAYFKYADFFIGNINLLLSTELPSLNLILPLAISFFTFQQVAYLVDSYREEAAEYSFLNYCLFVTFFPQLIAGPIVHHKEMMPQFAQRENKLLNWHNIALGIFIFALGLFKKVCIADDLAIRATAGFDGTGDLSFFEAWLTSLSYTFQLYFDFSGYSDMAIGAALLFNIRLPINFNSPYKALDIQDFWKRWHITLSRWLRDYLYIPLGGNRKGGERAMVNMFITMLLGGLWHGAGWTFVIWGAMHGAAIAVHRLWCRAGVKMPTVLAWFATFMFVNVAWIPFRATSFKDVERVLSGMFSFKNIQVSDKVAIWVSDTTGFVAQTGLSGMGFIELASLLVYFLIAVFARNTISYYEGDVKEVLTHGKLALLIAIFFAGLMSLGKNSDFLYFNF